ncbi:hypothetical protein [Saprospira grandis]|uniref:Uncharacterized protein n=1 Tax=Saprospira grandis (strain Lewin) TaxID=984262 RepID=H6L5Y1_SAPGL|nr:hypothetical protein [Saprospira grandis]AFC26541.1 hypothetical protein SGRA_3825 [Saprospira grandis str. Lewin]
MLFRFFLLFPLFSLGLSCYFCWDYLAQWTGELISLQIWGILLFLLFQLPLMFWAFRQRKREKLSAAQANWSYCLGILHLLPLLLYGSWALQRTDYIYLVLLNNGTEKLENLQLEGCSQNQLPSLAAGDKQAVWIQIETDCHLQLYFNWAGQSKDSLLLVPYTTRGLGERLDISISPSF